MHYIPNNQETEKELLNEIGVDSFEELLKNIPEKFLQKSGIDIPEALSETEVSAAIHTLAEKNKNTSKTLSYLGGGSYDHFVPAVVDYLLSRSEFYTAYTPYQAEVSQGTLQAIYEYQSLICKLFDMEVANASLYDSATALAEAGVMAANSTRRKKILVSPLIHPNSREVLETYMKNRDIEIEYLAEKNGLTEFGKELDDLSDIAGVIVQSPNFLGNIEKLNGLKDSFSDSRTLLILSTDPLANSILKSPGELGADIAVAEGQPLGIHQSFGGPYLGIFTAKAALMRKMPGRIIGKTVDIEGNPGFVMVLQTREQHIRREKATSNICTNQGLMALAATIYLALMGKNGLKQVGELCLNKSHKLAQKIAELPGYELGFKDAHFFKEFVIKTPVSPQIIIEAGLKENIFAGIDMGKYRQEWSEYLLISVTEKRNDKENNDFVKFLSKF